MNAQHSLGSASEHTAAAFFMSRGYTVYWPACQHGSADLLVERDGTRQTVQVKTACWRKRRAGKREYLTVNARKGGFRKYKPEDFDLLVAIDGARLWIISHDELREHGKFNITLDTRGAFTYTGGAAHKGLKLDPSKWLHHL